MAAASGLNDRLGLLVKGKRFCTNRPKPRNEKERSADAEAWRFLVKRETDQSLSVARENQLSNVFDVATAGKMAKLALPGRWGKTVNGEATAKC